MAKKIIKVAASKDGSRKAHTRTIETVETKQNVVLTKQKLMQKNDFDIKDYKQKVAKARKKIPKDFNKLVNNSALLDSQDKVQIRLLPLKQDNGNIKNKIVFVDNQNNLEIITAPTANSYRWKYNSRTKRLLSWTKQEKALCEKYWNEATGYHNELNLGSNSSVSPEEAVERAKNY